MTPSALMRLIAWREIRERLRNRAFVLGTLIPALVLAAVVTGFGLVSGDEPPSYTLGVVGPVPEGFTDHLGIIAEQRGVQVRLTSIGDREGAVEAIRDGSAAMVLVAGRELLAEGVPPLALQGIVDTAHQRARLDAVHASGELSEDQVASLLEALEPLPVVDADGRPDAGPLSWAMAFAVTILLFMSVMTNAGSLLTGAVEEKSNRVVEVLLGVVRPWHLLAAKVVALTALALTQITVFLGAILVPNALVGTFSLPPATASTLIVALVMIPIGFVFYASLYTVAGSLVSSVEDAQATAGPLGLAVGAAYFAVLFVVIPSPRGIAAQVLTFLPPTAPFTVPARVALGAVPLGEVALAVVVTLAGAALVVRLAGRLYAASLLAGGRLGWREAWRGEPIR